jgi:hypothetical protein
LNAIMSWPIDEASPRDQVTVAPAIERQDAMLLTAERDECLAIELGVWRRPERAGLIRRQAELESTALTIFGCPRAGGQRARAFEADLTCRAGSTELRAAIRRPTLTRSARACELFGAAKRNGAATGPAAAR